MPFSHGVSWTLHYTVGSDDLQLMVPKLLRLKSVSSVSHGRRLPSCVPDHISFGIELFQVGGRARLS